MGELPSRYPSSPLTNQSSEKDNKDKKERKKK
jgi:hypothetical protein